MQSNLRCRIAFVSKYEDPFSLHAYLDAEHLADGAALTVAAIVTSEFMGRAAPA
jgi:hypothetical protein